MWYSEERTGRGRSPPRPLLAVPNVTAHPSTASVPITVLLYNGLLLCGFSVPRLNNTLHYMQKLTKTPKNIQSVYVTRHADVTKSSCSGNQRSPPERRVAAVSCLVISDAIVAGRDVIVGDVIKREAIIRYCWRSGSDSATELANHVALY